MITHLRLGLTTLEIQREIGGRRKKLYLSSGTNKVVSMIADMGLHITVSFDCVHQYISETRQARQKQQMKIETSLIIHPPK